MTTSITLKKDKAAEEVAFVRMLCENLADVGAFDTEPQNPPEPDVLVKASNDRIGVEVTEIHGNPRLRMIEGEQDKVLDRADHLWADRGLPPVGIWVHWSPTLLPRRLERELPQKLVEFIGSRLPAKPGSLEIDSPELTAALGDQCIEHIFVYTDWETPSEWNWARRWQGGTVGAATIQREIDRKSPKPAQYRSAYAECWLLLVHPGGSPSSGFDLSPEILQAVFVSPFDRVYILSLIGPKVRRLQLATRRRSSNER
jgi:hypothetical protein